MKLRSIINQQKKTSSDRIYQKILYILNQTINNHMPLNMNKNVNSRVPQEYRKKRIKINYIFRYFSVITKLLHHDHFVYNQWKSINT